MLVFFFFFFHKRVFYLFIERLSERAPSGEPCQIKESLKKNLEGTIHYKKNILPWYLFLFLLLRLPDSLLLNFPSSFSPHSSPPFWPPEFWALSKLDHCDEWFWVSLEPPDGTLEEFTFTSSVPFESCRLRELAGFTWMENNRMYLFCFYFLKEENISKYVSRKKKSINLFHFRKKCTFLNFEN